MITELPAAIRMHVLFEHTASHGRKSVIDTVPPNSVILLVSKRSFDSSTSWPTVQWSEEDIVNKKEGTGRGKEICMHATYVIVHMHYFCFLHRNYFISIFITS
jgi:hypothetical protein